MRYCPELGHGDVTLSSIFHQMWILPDQRSRRRGGGQPPPAATSSLLVYLLSFPTFYLPACPVLSRPILYLYILARRIFISLWTIRIPSSSTYIHIIYFHILRSAALLFVRLLSVFLSAFLYSSISSYCAAITDIKNWQHNLYSSFCAINIEQQQTFLYLSSINFISS